MSDAPVKGTKSGSVWGFFFMYEGIMTGGPKRSLDTAIAAKSHGLHPVLISNQPSPVSETAESHGIPVRFVDVPKSLWQRKGKAISLNPFSVLEINKDMKFVSSQISQLIQDVGMGGLWVRGVKNVLMSNKASRKNGIPLVWDIGAEYKSKGLVAAIHYLAFRASSKVVAQGDSVLKQTFPGWLLERFRQKTVALIPGLSPERVNELASIYGHYDRNQPICVIGTVNNRKNQRALIEACNRLFDQGMQFKLRIIGDTPDQDYFQSCSELTEQHDSNYEWFGWSNDVVGCLKNGAALAIVSKQEGLPQVVLEAMHAGRPVISVPVGGVPDLIRDRENGFLAESGQVDDIVSTLQKFLQASAERLEEIRQCLPRDCKFDRQSRGMGKKLRQTFGFTGRIKKLAESA